jgi:uncharacterized protein (TIGR00106 family)
MSSKMKATAELQVIPVGEGISVRQEIMRVVELLQGHAFILETHASGTNIEGEWNEVFAAIKRCHEAVHEMGAPRIATTIRLGTRTDRSQSMDDKVRSVREKLGESDPNST